jgi:hypothetical protein
MLGIRMFLGSPKIVKKTLIPTVWCISMIFLSLKNDVNVPSKSNEQTTFFPSSRSLTKIAGSGSISQRLRIRGSGYEQKCHRSPTLFRTDEYAAGDGTCRREYTAWRWGRGRGHWPPQSPANNKKDSKVYKISCLEFT